MRRRAFLALSAASAAGLAGCTVTALPGADAPATPAETCPDLLDADRTVCPGDEGGPLAVSRSSGSVRGEGWRLQVAVANRGVASYGVNPYAWSVYRETADGWARVAPDAFIEPWLELGPGEGYAWLLAADEVGETSADQQVRLDLDPGSYAFAVSFQGPDRIAVVVPFTVEA